MQASIATIVPAGNCASQGARATRRKSLRCRLRPLASCSQTENTSFARSEEHTSELQSLMRISYAVFCLKKKKNHASQQDYSHTPLNHATPTQYLKLTSIVTY